jgi:hypothetical protein
VADNLALDDFVTEGEEILFGTNLGIVTDIQTVLTATSIS